MKKLRLLLITLCVSVLMGSMAVTAYAGGGEEWDGLAPVEPLPTETVDSGEGFTEDGNLVTRDLLYDKATNKQFITVQTSGGNTFYIVIDYDKPTDEDGEQYQTYFLNMVDEADLLAAMQAAGGELPECSCTDKCAVGTINTDCAVCGDDFNHFVVFYTLDALNEHKRSDDFADSFIFFKHQSRPPSLTSDSISSLRSFSMSLNLFISVSGIYLLLPICSLTGIASISSISTPFSSASSPSL